MQATGSVPAGPLEPWGTLRRPRAGAATYVLASISAVMVVVTWSLVHQAATTSAVNNLTAYRTDDEGWLVLVRLPLSAFAPADPLPVWVAALEMFAAVAIGCAVLGWRLALVVGVVAHVTASLLVRAVVSLPHGVPARIAEQYRGELDTGPSVVFMSLVICALLVTRRYLLSVAFVIAAAAVGALSADLAGLEHLVALAVGAIAALILTRRNHPPEQAGKEAS